MSSVMSLQEENRVLQGELARLEDLLAHSRADRDELAIKYAAISERVRQQHILPSQPSSSNYLFKKLKNSQAMLVSIIPFLPFEQFWYFFV